MLSTFQSIRNRCSLVGSFLSFGLEIGESLHHLEQRRCILAVAAFRRTMKVFQLRNFSPAFIVSASMVKEILALSRVPKWSPIFSQRSRNGAPNKPVNFAISVTTKLQKRNASHRRLIDANCVPAPFNWFVKKAKADRDGNQLSRSGRPESGTDDQIGRWLLQIGRTVLRVEHQLVDRSVALVLFLSEGEIQAGRLTWR